MTNVSGTPDKVRLRKLLFQIGVKALEKEGWHVERIPKAGKSSVRRITKGRESRRVAIRTTQDTYISFPRNAQDSEWVTLSDVDTVVAVSVDEPSAPRFAKVHLIDGDDMRDRFDRAYAARLAADHSIPAGRGVWVPLYVDDATSPPSHVGGGAGKVNPPIAVVPLPTGAQLAADGEGKTREANGGSGGGRSGGKKAATSDADGDDLSLTIAQAKRGLARHLGVDPSSIRITVEA
jgi:hypothetical protein